MPRQEYKKVIVKIPKSDYDEFREICPSYGSLTWLVRECIRKFNELHEGYSADKTLDEVIEDVKESMI